MRKEKSLQQSKKVVTSVKVHLTKEENDDLIQDQFENRNLETGKMPTKEEVIKKRTFKN